MELAPVLARAADQHGVLSRPDLDRLDVGRRQLDRLLRQGILERAGHRTFRLPGRAPDGRRAVMAACLDTGGVASHATAAALHGLGSWDLRGRPTVLVQRTGSPRVRSPLATVRTTTWLPIDDVVTVDRIPCTSVARTLLLLAAPKFGLTKDGLRDMVDTAVASRKASDRWLWWRLEHVRRTGRPGIAAFEAVLVDRSTAGPTESWLERAFLDLLAESHLPAPVCQQRIARRGAFVGRVDFAYEDAKVVIEVSGHAYHASRERLAADAARRNHLQLAGYRVLEFTYDDVVRRPDAVAAIVRQSLGLP